MEQLHKLNRIASEARVRCIEMSCRAKTAHLGSALSVVDILVAIYWGSSFNISPENVAVEGRDRIILSKGHAVSALYAVLASRGFFPEERLTEYNQNGGDLPEHPAPRSVPGIEFATGSLGHGLPVGLGMALSSRITEKPFKVVVVMSDGECNEGSVWEAAMMAAAQNVDNLVAIVDYNKWQATGRSQEVLQLASLQKKWESFGWYVQDVDGHNMPALLKSLENACQMEGRPSVIIANTVKGKGVSFMEDDNNWHYRSPTPEEVEQAKQELGFL